MSQKHKVVPQGLSLKDFQKKGVLWAVKRSRSLLADDMGTGKTIQSIVCSSIWNHKYTIVVAPSTMCETWAQEYQKWDIHKRSIFIVQGGKKIHTYNKERVIISSMDSLKHLIKILPREFCLIVDEYHNFKKWTSQRNHFLSRHLLPRARMFLALTGTPIENVIEDLHPLVSMLAPGKFGSMQYFLETYSVPYQRRVGSKVYVEYRGVNEKNLPELRKKLAPLYLRRTKEEVLPELPEKIYMDHYIEVPKEVKKKSLQYETAALKALQTGKSVSMYLSEEDKELYATARKNLGIAKVKGCVQYYMDLLNGNAGPLVVGAHHHDVIHALENEFKRKGVSKIRIAYGKSTPREKDQLMKDFQAGKLDVCILGMTSMGIGITLHRANNICLAERLSVPGKTKQFIDRVHRIGQTRGVVVHVAHAKGSLDTKIWGDYKRKMSDIGKVI